MVIGPRMSKDTISADFSDLCRIHQLRRLIGDSPRGAEELSARSIRQPPGLFSFPLPRLHGLYP
jgi:hypothetical protein